MWTRWRARTWLLGSALALVEVTSVGCRPEPTVEPTKPRRRRKPKPKTRPTVEQILAASDLPETRTTADPADPMAVTIHRLSNGLTVFISRDPSRPRVETAIAIRAGSRHDPRDSTGLAHYLEHMLFKGSDELGTADMDAERPHLETIAALYAELRQTNDEAHRSDILADIDRETALSANYAIPNELDRVYAELGIEEVNAFTSDDVTAYVSAVPNNRLEAWAKLEGERFVDPEFRLFWPELEAVYEEKNRALDDPEDRVYQAMRLALFPDHPYGTNDTLGTVEHLKNPAFLEMADFYRRWYVPNNAAVFMVGDVDPETVIPLLESSFSAWKPQRLELPDGGNLRALDERREVEVPAPGAESVLLAWPTVPIGHEDAPSLQVMDLLMNNAHTGLLDVKLGIPQVVPEVGSWNDQLTEAGYWAASATARDGQGLDLVEKLLLAVIADLKAGKFDHEDLTAVVLNERIAMRHALEDPQARLMMMLDAYIGRRPWPAPLNDIERLADVTPEQVVEVANRYLGDAYVSVRRVEGTPPLPSIQKPAITPLDLGVERRSEFATGLLALPASPIEPHWVVAEEDYRVERPARGRAGGSRPTEAIVATKNERNDLFSVRYHVDRGFREQPLLCVALTLLEVSGRRTPDGVRSATDLQRELYALGSEVRFSCNAESTSIVVDGVVDNRDATLDLVRAWLESPALDPGVLDALRANILTHRRNTLHEPEDLARAVRDFARYGDDSAWLHQPSNERLARATTDTLKRELQRMLGHRMQTTYFGPDADREGLSDALRLSRGRRDPRPPPPRRFRKGKGVQIFVVDSDVAKSIVHIASDYGDRPDDERAAAALYGNYLGGDMSALLFQQIREARGYAYSVSGHVSTGSGPDDAWALTGSVETQTDKTIQALALYLELIAPPTDEGLDPVRVEVARAGLEASYRTERIDPRSLPETVLAWLREGFVEDPRPGVWSQFAALDAASLFERVQAWNGDHVLVGIVGNVDQLDMDGLSQLGQVTVVSADALFGYGEFPATAPE